MLYAGECTPGNSLYTVVWPEAWIPDQRASRWNRKRRASESAVKYD
jgi:hypothetical protein